MKIIYSNNHLDRPTFLLAQAFCKETAGTAYNVIINHLDEAICDIKPDFVVLNQQQILSIQNFFNKKHSDKSCKFLTITTFIKKQIEELKTTSSLEIYNIPPGMFCHINEYHSSNIQDKNYWLCDISSIDSNLIKKIQPLIYPNNTTQKIRLVNNDQFQHPQNVGLATESEMMELIASCKGFINLNNTYTADAVFMAKPILSFVPNGFVPVSNNIDISHPQLFKISTITVSNENQIFPSRIIKECLKTYALLQ